MNLIEEQRNRGHVRPGRWGGGRERQKLLDIEMQEGWLTLGSYSLSTGTMFPNNGLKTNGKIESVIPNPQQRLMLEELEVLTTLISSAHIVPGCLLYSIQM